MTTQKSTHINKTTTGILTGTSTLFVVAILVVVQLISLKHNGRYDLTSNKRFTLSEQTKKVLQNLENPLMFYSFYNESEADFETVKDLLQQYADITPKVKFQFVDADKEPLTAQRFQVNAYSTVIVEYDGKNRKITVPSEKDFTNAIVKLTHGEQKKKIYFLTLHGELDTQSVEASGISQVLTLLEESNYEVSNLNLLQEGRVPEDCSILVIAGPKQELEDTEIKSLETYLAGSGNLLLLLDPLTSGKLVTSLARYGIQIGNDIIIDPKGYQNVLQPVVEQYPAHAITENFDLGTIFQLARSVKPAEKAPDSMQVVSIVKTNEECWTKESVGNIEKLTADYVEGKDKKGAVSLAVAATITSGKEPAGDDAQAPGGSKIVVYGDADFVNNVFLNSIGNAALIMNTFHWLAEEKDLIAIPPKDTLSQPMTLTTPQLASAFWIPVVIIPFLILGIGGSRIYQRRHNG
jgi:ABC-type uncharacterized transport system involved in gliding motility auxiliary subunit